MKGTLYLIRHAKAEDRALGTPDFHRKLTEKGIKQFRELMPKVRNVLTEHTDLKVWTSPLVRAEETADILTEALGMGNAEEKEFLANGNIEKMLALLKNEPDDFAVACVGHEPYTSMWTARLTGVDLYFPKGGVAQIVFDGTDTKATLQLKLAPKKAKGWQ